MFPGPELVFLEPMPERGAGGEVKKCCQEINFGSIPYTNLTPNRNRTYIPCLEGRCSIH